MLKVVSLHSRLYCLDAEKERSRIPEVVQVNGSLHVQLDVDRVQHQVEITIMALQDRVAHNFSQQVKKWQKLLFWALSQ
jgi:hypothetical protein